MTNPLIVACPADEWTKIATDVTSGNVHRILKNPDVYLQTYRDTGDAAPTTTVEGVPVFVGAGSAEISASVGIDVYIYAAGAAGSVRVDV